MTAAVATRALLVVDVDRHTVTLHGRPVNLPRKQYELLAELAVQPSRCLSHDRLLRDVWGWHMREAWRLTATLRTHTCKLRRALGHDKRFVVSVWGRGYRLVQPGDEHLVEFIAGGQR